MSNISTESADYEPESFEEWFAKMQLSPELMSLVHQIYQFDQAGKARNETLVVSLVVKRKIPTDFVGSKIDSLSNFMAVGMIDDLIALRNKKNNP